MTERWVKATFSINELADLDPMEKGKPCWVNMAHITRIRVRSLGTHLESYVGGRSADLGPFLETPDYFMGDASQ